MEIKFSDINQLYTTLKQETNDAIDEVLNRGDFICGRALTEFEVDFADYNNARYCVGTSSGLSALELSMRALGIGRGDEVITAVNSFVATALAISNVGATPVLCDCNSLGLIDVNKIEELITEKTKAIMPVNLFGQFANLSYIRELCDKHNIFLISDSCQSHGATYKGQPCSAHSDISCFSFYPAKNLGGICDGGAIVTNHEPTYNKIKTLRNYGSEKKYEHNEIGTNARLDTINAAVLKLRLRKLDEWNENRNNAAQLYTELLNGVGDIVTPIIAPYNTHNFHLYVIHTKYRDELQKYMQQKYISCQIHYPIIISKQKCYPELNHLSFPIAENAAKEILSLPIHSFITELEIEYIVESIHEFFKTKNQ